MKVFVRQIKRLLGAPLAGRESGIALIDVTMAASVLAMAMYLYGKDSSTTMKAAQKARTKTSAGVVGAATKEFVQEQFQEFIFNPAKLDCAQLSANTATGSPYFLVPGSIYETTPVNGVTYRNFNGQIVMLGHTPPTHTVPSEEIPALRAEEGAIVRCLDQSAPVPNNRFCAALRLQNQEGLIGVHDEQPLLMELTFTFMNFETNAAITCNTFKAAADKKKLGGRVDYTLYWFDQAETDYTSRQEMAYVTYPRTQSIFVTSMPHTGDFDGIDGADRYCQQLADASGSKVRGRFKALLSGPNAPALDRVKVDRFVEKTDGTVLVYSGRKEDFWKTNGLLIDRDEKGAPKATGNIWSGSTGAGLTHTSHCNGWNPTDPNTANGQIGIITPTGGSGWISSAATTCNASAYLYCLSQ